MQGACDNSRIAFGALSTGRSSSHRVNTSSRKPPPSFSGTPSSSTLWGAPTSSNPADAPSRRHPTSTWRNGLPELLQLRPASLFSQQAENELRQLKEPLDADSCVSLRCSFPLESSSACSPAASFAIAAASPVWLATSSQPEPVCPLLTSAPELLHCCR